MRRPTNLGRRGRATRMGAIWAETSARWCVPSALGGRDLDRAHRAVGVHAEAQARRLAAERDGRALDVLLGRAEVRDHDELRFEIADLVAFFAADLEEVLALFALAHARRVDSVVAPAELDGLPTDVGVR